VEVEVSRMRRECTAALSKVTTSKHIFMLSQDELFSYIKPSTKSIASCIPE
jgi:hypothetical protein